MTNSEMNTSKIKSLVKLYDDLYNEKDVIKFDKELLKDEKKIRISEINIIAAKRLIFIKLRNPFHNCL